MATGGVKARKLAGQAAGSIASTHGFAPKGSDRNKGGEKVSPHVKWLLNDTSDPVAKGQKDSGETAW